MALRVVCTKGGEPAELEFEITDTNTDTLVEHKLQYRKTKDIYELELKPNSANIKFISLNKFIAASGEEGEATFEDKTAREPRKLGTTDPNKNLRDYMDEDLARYDEIIAAAQAKAEANKGVKLDPNSEEGIIAKMNALMGKLSPEAQAALQEQMAPKKKSKK
jgi:hypothetical protein